MALYRTNYIFTKKLFSCAKFLLIKISYVQVPQQGNRSLYLPYSVPEEGQAVSKVLKLKYGRCGNLVKVERGKLCDTFHIDKGGVGAVQHVLGPEQPQPGSGRVHPGLRVPLPSGGNSGIIFSLLGIFLLFFLAKMVLLHFQM